MSNGELSSQLRDILGVPPQWADALPGPFIFSKMWGSHSHNTALPSSDHDYLMVYVARTEQMLGLMPPTATVTRTNPDMEAHELLKFCQLLLKGNPSMVECLFTERRCTMLEPWPELVANRERFLSRRVVLQYLGYGQGQLKRYESGARLHTKGGKVGEKWLYHMIRVLQDGNRIAAGEAPIVWKDGVDREILMAIREGRVSDGHTIALARQIIDEIDARKPWPLPDQGDMDWLNRWLVDIRKGGLQ